MNRPGIYRFVNKSNTVIYIGKSNNLERRIIQHENISHLPIECYREVYRIDYIKTKTEADALMLEQYFINSHKPCYNIKDKTRDYITINLDDSNYVWKVYKYYENGIYTYTNDNVIDIQSKLNKSSHKKTSNHNSKGCLTLIVGIIALGILSAFVENIFYGENAKEAHTFIRDSHYQFKKSYDELSASDNILNTESLTNLEDTLNSIINEGDELELKNKGKYNDILEKYNNAIYSIKLEISTLKDYSTGNKVYSEYLIKSTIDSLNRDLNKYSEVIKELNDMN